jgi:hypothetical protein
MWQRSIVVLATVLAACGTSSSGSAVGDGGGTTAPSGSPNGCRFGLPTCDGACVDLSENDKHCGACGNACGAGTVCYGGKCETGTCAEKFREQCGDACVRLDRDPDNCGTCGHACPDGQLCRDKVCTAVVGSGESCADPLILTASKQDEAFTLVGAAADEAPLSCGDPTKRADRAFRWTATKTKNTKARVDGGTPADDLVLEVFTDAPCTKATSLSCNNDETSVDKRPEAEFEATSGKTYFIVVSSFGEAPAGRFYLHVDD